MSDAVIGLTVVVAFMAFIIFMMMFVAVGVIVVLKTTNTNFTGPLMIPLISMPSQVIPPEKSNNENISDEMNTFFWGIKNKFPDLLRLLAFVQSQKKAEDEKLKKEAEEKEANDEKLKKESKDHILNKKVEFYMNVSKLLQSVEELKFNYIAHISSVAGGEAPAQAQARNPAGGGGEAPPAAL